MRWNLRFNSQILVLEKGRVVGLGSHLDLLQQVPYYQEIVHAQEEGEANA